MKSLNEERCVEEIRTRLAGLRAEDLGLWGTMSASAMVCHLREAFRFALGEERAAPVKMSLPGGVVKYLALWTPMQWPKNVPTVPELKTSPACVPRGFEEDYAGLMEALQRFLEARGNRTDHAMFGTMSPEDWMRWGYLHTDHHLRQFGR